VPSRAFTSERRDPVAFMMTEAPGTMLLYHGAGSDRDHTSLLAIERAVTPWACVRANFPYREQGRKSPDRVPKLMAAVRLTLEEMEAPVVMGGRSMGGRICSMVAAGADSDSPPSVVAGLVLISYPLHPPGKPETLRVEHLADIAVPCLFIQGSRDSFGTPEELSVWTSSIPGDVRTVVIDGGRHDLRGADERIADVTRDWLADLVRSRR